MARHRYQLEAVIRRYPTAALGVPALGHNVPLGTSMGLPAPKNRLHANIYGYRQWTTGSVPGVVASPHNGMLWRPGEVTAQCDRVGYNKHTPPGEGCSCGLYAHKQWETMGRLRPQPGIILGIIQYYGKLIEHEYGYRGEKAYIVRLLVGETQNRHPAYDWRNYAQVYGGDRVWVVPENYEGPLDHLWEVD